MLPRQACKGCLRAVLALQRLANVFCGPPEDPAVLQGCRSRHEPAALPCIYAFLLSKSCLKGFDPDKGFLTLPLCASSPLPCTSPAGGQGLSDAVDGLCSSRVRRLLHEGHAGRGGHCGVCLCAELPHRAAFLCQSSPAGQERHSGELSADWVLKVIKGIDGIQVSCLQTGLSP